VLKELASVAEPDRRFAYMAGPDGCRAMTVADHYDAVRRITLPAGVPDVVAAQFDRARHAFIYAWYCYDLAIVAELQAFGALETALRIRFDAGASATPPRGLSRLLRAALAQGWLPAEFDGDADALPQLRNHLAHGTDDIITPGMALAVIGRCASIIGAVWRDGASATSPALRASTDP
jgi:hypothetical protein